MARAIAFMYPDGVVEVARSEDEDDVDLGFISRMEFAIPDEHGREWPWDDIVKLGTKKIRERIAILPNGTFGDRGPCRSCGAEVVFVQVASGKRPPFDLDGRSHFETCPDSESWRTSSPRSSAR